MARSETLQSRPISGLGVPPPADLPESARALVAAHHEENWIKALSLNPDTASRLFRASVRQQWAPASLEGARADRGHRLGDQRLRPL
jgi:hypothetical protein